MSALLLLQERHRPHRQPPPQARVVAFDGVISITMARENEAPSLTTILESNDGVSNDNNLDNIHTPSSLDPLPLVRVGVHSDEEEVQEDISLVLPIVDEERNVSEQKMRISNHQNDSNNHGLGSSSLLPSIKSCLQNNQFLDRTKEKEILLQAFRRCCFTSSSPHDNTSKGGRGQPELLLLSGPSGCGKNHLVTSTLTRDINSVIQNGVFFLKGKFDLLQRPEPYRAFVTAFTDFASQIALATANHSSDHQEKAHVMTTARNAILEAMKDGAGILTGMIPALNGAMVKREERSCDTQHQPGEGATSSFAHVFRRFVKTICSPEHPVMFLLENLQWADPCSLDLLSALLTDKDCNGVLFIGTCCDDQAVPTSDNDNSRPLATWLQKLQGSVPITNVSIHNLSKLQITAILRQVLQRSEKPNSLELADLIYSQTHGNLYNFLEFIRWLEDEKLLKYEPDHGHSQWDVEEIALTIRCHCVGDFMVDKMEQLPSQVQEVLKIASCLGTTIHQKLLQMVVGGEVIPALKVAKEHGLLVSNPEGSFCFAHDVAQKVSYALIPPECQSEFHLMIGKKLWQRLDEQELDQHVFTLASQFIRCDNPSPTNEEKAVVAALCLHAGRKAAKSSTFRMALTYFNAGIELLGPTCWREHYVLSLELHNAAAEMALCTANFTRMDDLLDAVFSNINNFPDKLQAYATRIYSLGIRDQQQQAIDEGQAVLKELGVTFPNRHLQRTHILREMASIRLLLQGKSDSMLLRMPAMEDTTKVSIIRILDLVFLSSLIARPSFAPPIILNMMKMTLQHGSSPWTANAFAMYGMLCCIVGRVDEGFRFGQLALKVLETSRRREFLPRVYGIVYGCMYSWKRPICDTFEPLRYAHGVGLETGDVEFGFVSANFLCMNSFEAGVPLPPLEKDLKSFCDMMATRKQQPLLRMCMIALQIVHHLMGFTDDPLSLAGDIIDMGAVMDHATELNIPMLKTATAFRRTFLAYIFDDLDIVLENLEEWRGRIFSVPPSAILLSACFVDGLVALMVARRRPNERRKNLRIADVQIRRFKKLANDSPQNCLDKLFLLEAEKASVLGKHKIAVKKYTCANALAADSGCLWSQAIANERAGEHLSLHGDATMARSFLQRAYEVWDQWGAYAKAQRLNSKWALHERIQLRHPAVCVYY